MEQVYAVGVSIIEFTQYWFSDYSKHLQLVNDIANPHYAFEYMLPFVAAVDSVFGAQFLLCMAFGSWMNCVLKWWLSEDRPYWWVHETSFYSSDSRPRLHQLAQTCETGPGSPSGHTTVVGMEIMLLGMWYCHVMTDRKRDVWWMGYLMFLLVAWFLPATMVARVFVAAHFPHQCLVGAACGLLLAPFLCIYVTDPFVWGNYTRKQINRRVVYHVLAAMATIVISVATYWGMKWAWHDPLWTIQLAFKWCEDVGNIHVSTTPLYALVQATASLLGAALVITPALARYRHYTKQRSILIAFIVTAVAVYGFRHFQNDINKDKAWWFYSMNFVVYGLKPVFFLKIVPSVAMWPYRKAAKEKSVKDP